jgi:hypothetical protein
MQSNAVTRVVQFLNSANIYSRVEALHILLTLSFSPDCVGRLFSEHKVLTRMIVLVEEGLQLRSEEGTVLAQHALNVVLNWVIA